MRAQDFAYLTRLLKERSGLALSSDKVYLVESRLMPVARRRGIASLDELMRVARDDAAEDLLADMVEAMATTDSAFFRDIAPFSSLGEEVLPRLVEARRAEGIPRIRIWSAACAGGQEPYSIAMMLADAGERLAGIDIEIVATDFSREMVARAEAGLYSQFEVQQGLPVRRLVEYFTPHDERWQIADRIRERVRIKRFNLLNEFQPLGRFDVVLCRNVLCYFDQPGKSDVLRRLSMILPNDGALYLGASESVLGLSRAFKPLAGVRGAYCLADDGYAQPEARERATA